MKDSDLVLSFRDDFAKLYNLSEIPITISHKVRFTNEVTVKAINFGIGAGRRPNAPPGPGKSVFVSVRILISSGSVIYSTSINHVPTGDVLAFIRESTLTVRFYLYQGDVNPSSIQFEPAIDADSVLDAFVIADPPALNSIKEDIVETLVDKGQKFLESLNRSAHFSLLDEHVRPWLVGGVVHGISNEPFGLQRIGYSRGAGDVPDANGNVEPATGDLVVWHVGQRQVKPEGMANAPNVEIDVDFNVNDGSIPLFNNIALEEEIDILPVVEPGGPIGGGHTPNPFMRWLQKIEHIVVLMQENRSFDQVLGYLRREKINNEVINIDVNGLLPDDDPGHLQQVNRLHNEEFRPRKAEVYSPNPGPVWTSPTAWPMYSLPSPGHSADAVADQIDGGEGGSPGAMKGFVSNFIKRIGEPRAFLPEVSDGLF